MTKDLDTLTVEELGRLFPIIISEPKDEWADLFIQEKNRLIFLLGKEMAIRVEHIGSTAVPNLAAKPTIDILVEIPKGEDVKSEIIDIMTSRGYNHMREQTDHIMVVKGYTPEGFQGQCYHIHMGPKDHNELWDRLYFRDYLKANPQVTREYEDLKQELATKYKYNREAYTEAKTGFIERVTKTAINALK
ncbi:GrpB family protein [bacterium]|nr:GrpB family protein [bacterium]